MGTDREGRALGACEFIKVPVVGKDGKITEKEFRLRPVVAMHLADLEKKALECHKRNHLKTFRDNEDLLPPGRADEMLEKEFEKIAAWELTDLPQKKAHDASRVPLNGKLRGWIENHFGVVPDTEREALMLVTTALDQGVLSAKEVKNMTGKSPMMGYVRFDQWWVTASTPGMISYIHTSVKQDHPEVTSDDIQNWPLSIIAEASRKVEGITSASMGNG